MVAPELLRRCQHLADLSDAILTKMAAIAEERVVSAQETIFADMDPADKLYLLVRGDICLCCEMGSGEQRVMDTVGDGELFAWSSLVEPHRYTSTAVASRQSEVIAFDAIQLRTMCDEDQELGYQVLSKIVELLSGRLERVRMQLAES